MATGEVVSRILLSRDKLLRVKQLTVHTSAHLIYHSRLQIQEHGTGYVLSCSSLGEKRVERIIPASSRLVTRHLPIRLNTVLEAVQLPACISDLDTGLTDVDRDALSHGHS
jgi:hypothetical protein